MLRRTLRRLGSTNRYTDGSGRPLDTNELPRELFLQPISNRAYPSRGAHWEPVLRPQRQPSPHKGTVIISGGGVVGLSVGCVFALRGWHTTIVTRGASLLAQAPAGLLTPSSDNEKKKQEGQKERGAARHGSNSYETAVQRLGAKQLPYALLTRRAADALHMAGLRLPALRGLGVVVRGVLDHPGAYHSWLTRGLVELRRFPVNMLSIDLHALRRQLEQHVAALPFDNLQVFHEHRIEAVYPLRQQVVIQPYKPFTLDQRTNTTNTSNSSSSNAVVLPDTQGRREETSLTLSEVKWQKRYAAAAVEYDLLVCAEGVNARLRDLLDVEGFTADADFATRWFLLRARWLSHCHIHRWLHARRTSTTEHAGYRVKSAAQVPVAIAFPRLDGEDLFSVMVYMPSAELGRLSDEEVLREVMPDVAPHTNSDADDVQLTSLGGPTVPAPTIFCENLFNSVGLPSAVMVGDAAHYCNPFWMQSLALGLEDGVQLLNQVDAYSRHFYDALRQYSAERGMCGDALRELTERCLYYERKRHVNPVLRLRDNYARALARWLPGRYNTRYDSQSNFRYARSLNEMLNGRGYTSYEYAERRQAKQNRFFHFGRLYT